MKRGIAEELSLPSWKRAYREYLNGHNGHGDPLSFEEFCGRLSPLSGETFSKPEKPKPPIVQKPEPELGASDDPANYDHAEGSTGAWVPPNSKKKTPFANPHYQTRTDKPLAGRNQGKAESEGVYRPDNVGKIEEYRARGHVTVAGKHVAADGLVARSGRRRIAPEHMLRDIHDHEFWVDRAEDLAKIAKEILRGRNATVFEGRVIAPLRGDPKRSVEELAAQFDISPAKIHKITERAKDRIVEVFKQRTAPKTEGDKCPTCGRVYADWNFSECGRNNETVKDQYRGPTWLVRWAALKWPPRHMHPECLPYRYWEDAVALQKKYFNR